MGTVSRSNWNLEMLVFAEGGKPEKNPRSRDKNQQQTQPTNDAETGNRTRATLVGGETKKAGQDRVKLKTTNLSA